MYSIVIFTSQLNRWYRDRVNWVGCPGYLFAPPRLHCPVYHYQWTTLYPLSIQDLQYPLSCNSSYFFQTFSRLFLCLQLDFDLYSWRNESDNTCKAGIQVESKRRNTFHTISIVFFGTFWWSISILLCLFDHDRWSSIWCTSQKGLSNEQKNR